MLVVIGSCQERKMRLCSTHAGDTGNQTCGLTCKSVTVASEPSVQVGGGLRALGHSQSSQGSLLEVHGVCLGLNQDCSV